MRSPTRWGAPGGDATVLPTAAAAAAAAAAAGDDGEVAEGYDAAVEEEEEEAEEGDERENEGAPACVIVVDPMDVNGRHFCEELQSWGVEPLPVLSPAVAAKLADDGENSLADLAAPEPGDEQAWAAARGLDGNRPPLACLSESDTGIETALRLESALGCCFGNTAGAVRAVSAAATAAATAAASTTTAASPLKKRGVEEEGGGGEEEEEEEEEEPGSALEPGAEALRLKHATVDAVRAAGLRAPRQAMARSWAEAEAFLVRELGILDQLAGDGDGDVCGAAAEKGGAEAAAPAAAAPVAVLKPTRGAASIGVAAVGGGKAGLDAARAAFEALIGSPSHAGGDATNDFVLVQEFLGGTEYAVDTVSLAPLPSSSESESAEKTTHKVLAVWRYDKRAVNGLTAPTVYFSTQLQTPHGASSSSPSSSSSASSPAASDALAEARSVAAYVVRVLDAVGMRDGPAHTEVKWARREQEEEGKERRGSSGGDRGGGAAAAATTTGDSLSWEPCIVEVNARWHACNFRPLVDECVGYNAIDATVLAILARHDALRRLQRSGGGDEEEDEEEEALAELLDAGHACWDEIDGAAWQGRASEPSSSSSSSSSSMPCGRVVHLVSFVEGTLARVSPDQLAAIEALPSVQAVELSVAPGSAMEPTRDISATDCGQVRQVHPDPAVLEADYEAIVAAMPLLFEVEGGLADEEG